MYQLLVLHLQCRQWQLKPTANKTLLNLTAAKVQNYLTHTHARTHAHTHTFNGPFSGSTQVRRYQKGNTSEWQWHQLGHTPVCTLLQTDNHTSAPPLNFLQAGCPSCCPTNSIKAPKAHKLPHQLTKNVGKNYWDCLSC